MRKAMIVKVFLGSLIGLVAAGVLCAVALVLAASSGVFVMNGPDVVGVRPDPFGWSMLALAGFAVLVIVAASMGLFVAWIGAMLNTVNLADKTWFVVLLAGGLLSVGFLVTAAYVIAGPDGYRPAVPPVDEHSALPGLTPPPGTDTPATPADLAHR